MTKSDWGQLASLIIGMGLIFLWGWISAMGFELRDGLRRALECVEAGVEPGLCRRAAGLDDER